VKLVSISDIHGRLGDLERLRPLLESADVVLLAGDITNFGHADDALAIIEPLQERVSRLLAVSGNCDYPDVSQCLTDLGISIDSGMAIVDDLPIIGLGGSLPGPAPTPNEFSENQLAEHLIQAAKDVPAATPFLLVSHQPPRDTYTDRTFAGQHVGSSAVREFIEARQPMICFTAHIHESRGKDRIGTTHVVNPGPLGRGAVAIASIEGGRVETIDIQLLN
jgi:Icc-related predicted phosphoesterase